MAATLLVLSIVTTRVYGISFSKPNSPNQRKSGDATTLLFLSLFVILIFLPIHASARAISMSFLPARRRGLEDVITSSSPKLPGKETVTPATPDPNIPSPLGWSKEAVFALLSVLVTVLCCVATVAGSRVRRCFAAGCFVGKYLTDLRRWWEEFEARGGFMPDCPLCKAKRVRNWRVRKKEVVREEQQRVYTEGLEMRTGGVM